MFKIYTHRNFKVLLALPLLVASFTLFAPSSSVSADPVKNPICKSGATLVAAKQNVPAHCTCPDTKVVIVGSNETYSCAKACPSTTTSVKKYGETYCDPVDPATTGANATTGDGYIGPKAQPTGKYYCGDPAIKSVNTSIDLGCKGLGDPIMDLLFAIIRFMSYGVGLIIVGSLTYAGIQYIGSRGDPNANAQAVKRIQANVTALLLFVFAYAIINYIVPGKLLQ